MEAQFGYENLLHLMPFASDENAQNMSLSSLDDVYRFCCNQAVENNEMPPFPPSLPDWFALQQIPHYSYTDYFTEDSVPQLKREMPLLAYSEPEDASGIYLADSSSGTYIPKVYSSSPSQSKLPARTSSYSQKKLDPVSRKKATEVERTRRLRNAERLDALHELLPHPKKGGKASILDDTIDQIKYLQHQMKDLSRNRLVNQSTSNPLLFLEGCGHYLVHELKMSNISLEEKIGKLLEEDPIAATQLLQSRGLFIKPMHLSKDLHQSNFI